MEEVNEEESLRAYDAEMEAYYYGILRTRTKLCPGIVAKNVKTGDVGIIMRVDYSTNLFDWACFLSTTGTKEHPERLLTCEIK